MTIKQFLKVSWHKVNDIPKDEVGRLLKEIGEEYEANFKGLYKSTGTKHHAGFVKREILLDRADRRARTALGIEIPDPCPKIKFGKKRWNKFCTECDGKYQYIGKEKKCLLKTIELNF